MDDAANSLSWDSFAPALALVPSQARARLKIEQALAAARDLVEAEGVDAITLPRVASAAGLSAGSLHRYLPDREHLVAALSAVYHARIEALADALVAEAVASTVSTAAPAADIPSAVDSTIAAFELMYREQSQLRALRQTLQTSAQLDHSRAHKARMMVKVQALLSAHGIADEHSRGSVAQAVFLAADALMQEAFTTEGIVDDGLLIELRLMLTGYRSQAAHGEAL